MRESLEQPMVIPGRWAAAEPQGSVSASLLNLGPPADSAPTGIKVKGGHKGGALISVLRRRELTLFSLREDTERRWPLHSKGRALPRRQSCLQTGENKCPLFQPPP